MIPKYTQEQFEHAKSREFLELECEQCHNTFQLIKKRIKDAINRNRGSCAKYCSHKCSSSAQKIEKTNNSKCACCNKNFYKPLHKIGKSKNDYCSQFCANKHTGILRTKPKPVKIRLRFPKLKINCLNCGQLTKNDKYCSGTCRNKVNNKNIKGSKSKAEFLLADALKSNFPQWTIIENDRKILDGLELDIFIPEIKLAIEWNGIFHYEPIRGQNGLEKIISKDNRKIELCKQLNIELIVICDRTSHLKFIQETINTLIVNLKKMAGMTDTASV